MFAGSSQDASLAHTPPPPHLTLRPFPQLMIFQIQFLSTLRLLEANISKPFRDMLDKLKWLNLHFDDIDWGFAGCEDDEVSSTSPRGC